MPMINETANSLTGLPTYLRGNQARASRMRMDSARILKRFFFCEQALIISQSAWLAGIPIIEAKINLPKHAWQDALTAHALRERVFELRFPSHLMEMGDDESVIRIFEHSINAPSGEAFVYALANVFKPAFVRVYREYLEKADPIAEGPTVRSIRIAIEDKKQQIAELNDMVEALFQLAPERRSEAEAWARTLRTAMQEIGGLSIEAPEPINGTAPHINAKPFQFAEVPARDKRFHLLRFYWPDVVDDSFPYGEGIRLQLRSAVSHINEVWAIETAGAILYFFSATLGWDFIFNAARWCYDESRHCLMGYDRLTQWGFMPHEIPLGTYIYDSARGQDPVYRLGMLFYFETKNISKKPQRTKAFGDYKDLLSQHDMDFDWADETIHASYGSHWLGELNKLGVGKEIDEIRVRCDEMVRAVTQTATESERQDIRRIAENMIAKAERLAAA